MPNPPQSMNISVMRRILEEALKVETSRFYMTKDFGVSCGVQFFRDVMLMGREVPFVIEDYRLGMIERGEVEGYVNLMRVKLSAGSMAYLNRGSIVQVLSVSEDACVRGFVISENMMSQVFDRERPEIMDGRIMNFMLESSECDRRFVENITSSVFSLVTSGDYSPKVLASLFRAAIFYFNDAYAKSSQAAQLSAEGGRAMAVFNNFIALVNQEAAQERELGHYAEKLCLSPRYLSSIIAEQSGHPAKYWIDQAVLARAKVLLRHSGKSVSQIASELNFPNDSFFCKYFRRLEGLTPSQYRRSD